MRGGDDADMVSGAGWSELDPDSKPRAPTPTDDPLAADEERRYRRESLLGRGGMGMVHAVHDARLDRRVALKETARRDPSLAERLRREAQILAGLDHPGIVPLFDAGRGADGTPYYTMPKVEGITLEEALARCGADGQSPHDAAKARLSHLRSMLTVCQAVAHAHDRGVVHRDLKPSNVMLGARGQTVVLDWGLARREDDVTLYDAPADGGVPRLRFGDETPISGVPITGQALTEVGAVVGTPRYMAPEQKLGGIVDARSDVWSLGAILHCLLLGEPPAAPLKAKESAARLLRERAGRNWPFPMPSELAAIAVRALEADPEARYPNAGAMAADLMRFMDGRWVDAHDYSGIEILRTFARRYRTPLVLGAVATVCALTFGGWAWHRTDQERQRAVEAERVARAAEATSSDALHRSKIAERRTQAALDEADAALHDARIGQAQLAARVGARPEAELLALEALAMGESPVARGVLAAYPTDARPWRDPSGTFPLSHCTSVDLDPTAQRVVCLDDGRARVLDARTGHQISVWGEQLTTAKLLSPDTLFTATTDPMELTRVDLPSERSVNLGELHDPLAFASGVEDTHFIGDPAGLWVVEANANAPKRLTLCDGPQHPWAQSMSISQSGEQMAVLCGDMKVHFETTSPRKKHSTMDFGSLAISAMLLSPDGNTLWLGSSDGLVFGHDPRSGELIHTIETKVGRVKALVGSQDGGLLAVVGERRGVQIVDQQTAIPLWRLPAQAVTDVAFIGRQQLVVAGPQLQRWNLPANQQPRRFTAESGLSAIAVSHDAKLIAAATGAGQIYVWDRHTGAERYRQRWQKRVAKDVAFNHDDSILAASAMEQGPKAIDTRTWTRGPISTHAAPLRRVDWLGEDVLLGLTYGPEPLAMRGLEDPVSGTSTELAYWLDMQASADQSVAVMVEKYAGRVALVRAADLVEGRAPSDVMIDVIHEPGVFAVDLRASEGVTREVLVTTRHDVRVLDPSGRQLHRFEAPERTLTSAALDPEGRFVAAGTLSGRILVWSRETGELAAVLNRHDERTVSLRFTDGGETLVSGSWDHAVQLWDLRALTLDPHEALAKAREDWGMSANGVLMSLLD